MSDELKVAIMGIGERIMKREEARIRGEMEEVLRELDLKIRFLPEGTGTHFGNPAATTTYWQIRVQIVAAIVESRLHREAEKAIERFMAKVEGGSQ